MAMVIIDEESIDISTVTLLVNLVVVIPRYI